MFSKKQDLIFKTCFQQAHESIGTIVAAWNLCSQDLCGNCPTVSNSELNKLKHIFNPKIQVYKNMLFD